MDILENHQKNCGKFSKNLIPECDESTVMRLPPMALEEPKKTPSSQGWRAVWFLLAIHMPTVPGELGD